MERKVEKLFEDAQKKDSFKAFLSAKKDILKKRRIQTRS